MVTLPLGVVYGAAGFFKGSLHFLHTLAVVSFIFIHDGQTRILSVFRDVSPAEKRAIPAMAIPTPAK
jgi:hypothetical protein